VKKPPCFGQDAGGIRLRLAIEISPIAATAPAAGITRRSAI